MKEFNLNNFGKNLKFSQRGEKGKKIPLTEKEIFVELMTAFETAWDRSNESYEKYKINLLEYEEMFYQIIEGFIYLKYGDWKTEIIMWYIFLRKDEEGKIYSMKIKFREKNIEEEVTLNNPTELWDLLEKIDKESEIGRAHV